jgi:diguanylate cyclase (GGDEF)-like protein/PAS domain S-box-containing protein
VVLRDAEAVKLAAFLPIESPAPLLRFAMPAFQDPEIYRDILDGLQIGVSVLDLQKKIVFWSDGAEKITGFTKLEVLGHVCTDNILLHCNEGSCEMCNEKCPIAAALQQAVPIETMSFIRHKSGYRTEVHLWVVPLRDKNGSIIGIIQTFEGETAGHGADPNDRSKQEHGWLDEVTGLPNQPMMQSHLRETLGTFSELHVPFGIVFLEISNLDEFRTKYGQGASRSILQVLARTLRNTVWATDVVGIWSERQFLVILMGCSEEAMQAVSRRILRMLTGTTIKWWGEELSAKVLVGCTGAQMGDTVESILRRTQQAISGTRTAPPQPSELIAALSAKGSTG